MNKQLSPIEQDAATFRQEALDHYLKRENAATILRVSPPSVWIVFSVITGVMIAAIFVLYISEVEVTATWPGILRARTGVLPATPGMQITSFIPARDRAFIKTGDPVRITFEQLPSKEFKTLEGSITQISSHVASNELSDSFAEQSLISGPRYRVDISLNPPKSLSLRPGMLLSVHYTLTRERLITVLFTPSRRW